MKRFVNNFSTLAVLISGILFFVACDDDDPTLVVRPNQLVLNADDTTEKFITIETTAANWSYKVNKNDWLEVYTNPGDYKRLFIRTQKNMDPAKPRVAYITITAAGNKASTEIKVEQLNKETNDLSVSQNYVDFNLYEIGEKRLIVTTDASSWVALTDASWLQLDRQNQTLIVSAIQTNPLSIARTAEIIVTAGNALPIVVTVTQGQRGEITNMLSATPSALIFEASSPGTRLLTITSNVHSWTASSNASWVSLSKNTDLLFVSVLPNSTSAVRTDSITITAGDQTMKVLVTQAAFLASSFFSVNPTALAFNANETSGKSITISANGLSWSASTDDTWLQLGKFNNVLTVSPLTQNPTSAARTATIIINAGEMSPITVYVTQKP